MIQLFEKMMGVLNEFHAEVLAGQYFQSFSGIKI